MRQEPKKRKGTQSTHIEFQACKDAETNVQSNADQTELHRAAETLTKLETNMTNQGKQARNKARYMQHKPKPFSAELLQRPAVHRGSSRSPCGRCGGQQPLLAYETSSDSAPQTAGGTRWQSRRHAGARVEERRCGWLRTGSASHRG
jgi:hypothetical protein